MSVVYFIRCGVDGPIKIGTAGDAHQRLRDLSCASPYPLSLIGTIAGGQPLERRIHKALRDFRIHLEWFRPERRVLDFIDQCLSGNVETVLAIMEADVAVRQDRMAKYGEIVARLLLQAAREIGEVHGYAAAARESDIADDNVRRLAQGRSCGMATVLKLKTAFPEEFGLLDVLMDLPLADAVDFPSTLEAARDAIDAQLRRLKPVDARA
jgi:hypothetical protein